MNFINNNNLFHRHHHQYQHHHNVNEKDTCYTNNNKQLFTESYFVFGCVLFRCLVQRGDETSGEYTQFSTTIQFNFSLFLSIVCTSTI